MSPIAPIHVNAAFRSSRHNEAYIFMGNEYICEYYAPGGSNYHIVFGPSLISDGFPSLKGTRFGDHGIECAFDTDRSEAYIFSGNLCAHIDYAPHSKDDKILKGPISIGEMFPCFKGKVFEKRIDAAFRSTDSNEAYIFTGNQYARINYATKTVMYTGTIAEVWPCFAGTVFESGIDAAFASHIPNEAYIFKGDHCARLKFAPGTRADYIMGGVVHVVYSYWTTIGGVLSRKNGT